MVLLIFLAMALYKSLVQKICNDTKTTPQQEESNTSEVIETEAATIIKEKIAANEKLDDNLLDYYACQLLIPGQCTHEELSALDHLGDHLDVDEGLQFTIIVHTQRDGSTAVGKGREEQKVKEQITQGVQGKEMGIRGEGMGEYNSVIRIV